jgi:hypothetical protein
VLAPLCRAGTEQRAEGRLPGSRGPLDQRARAALEAAADELVQPGQSAFHALARRVLAVFGGDQARIDLEPAAADRVVVISAAKVAAAVL